MSDFEKENNFLSELQRALEVAKKSALFSNYFTHILKQERGDVKRVVVDTLEPVSTLFEKLVNSKTDDSKHQHIIIPSLIEAWKN